MESIYKDIYKLLTDAYSYPSAFYKLLNRQVEQLVQKSDQGKREAFLSLFFDLHQEKSEFVNKEGELYYNGATDLNNRFKVVETYIESFEPVIIENQARQRFYAQVEDTFYIRTVKVFKRFLQNIIWIFPRINNFFLMVLKKETNKLRYKKHKIKKQQLAKLVYLIYFLRDSKELFDKVFYDRQNLLIKIKDIEGNLYKDLLIFNMDGIKSGLSALKELESYIVQQKKEINRSVKNIENSLNNKFNQLLPKIGTSEFRSKKVKEKKINSKLQSYYVLHEKNINSYNLRYATLESYWNYKLDIYKVFIETSLQFNTTVLLTDTIIQEKIENPFIPFYDEIDNWVKVHLNKKEFDSDILSRKVLGEHLIKFTDNLLLFNIIPILDNLENKSKDYFQSVNSNIVIPRQADYCNPVNRKDIKKIDTTSISEPLFNKLVLAKIVKESNSLVELSQKVLQSVNEISKIIEFSIEFYTSSAEKQKEEIISEFYNSIVRAQTKVNETLKLIQDKRKSTKKNLNAINYNYIESFNAAVDPLTILQNYRKAQIKKQRERFKTKLKNSFIQLLRFSKKIWIKLIDSINFIHKNYTNLRVLFGISKPSESISNELSDYFSETETAINNLPVMYQRLFNSEPLKKERTYIPREKINKELNTAFLAWIKNKYAPTFITGEIGNGITTTINFFEKDINNKYPVSRFNITKQITEEDALLTFLKEMFNDLKFNSLNDLEALLNKSVTKRILILENIHFFFGRYNDGFSNIKLFLEFVSKTNKNVFWLCSVNLYAWKYLNYAISISDYFAYVIHIEGLSKEEMIKTIEDRHLPSGYDIRFLKRDLFKASKKIKKMSEEQKQVFLKQDFFNVFYKITQGNIKLALLFWQMSVHEVKDNTFYLKIKEIDHSFLESLGMPKLINLHNILIHGGLSIKEHSKIFDLSESASLSQLLILENDAIIVKNNDQYQINPLIYRHVVEHLKDIILIY